MTIHYTQKFLLELIKEGEQQIASLKSELASFEVDATPQTPTEGE